MGELRAETTNTDFRPVRIVCDLPFPVSTNRLWRGRYRGAYNSAEYEKWKMLAGQEWLVQRVRQPKGIQGKFRAILILDNPDNRHRDVDNYIKSVLDFAASMNLIENDSHCQAIYARWGSKEEAPKGCRLILRQVK